VQVWLLQVNFPLTAVLCCHNIAKQYLALIEDSSGAPELRVLTDLTRLTGFAEW